MAEDAAAIQFTDEGDGLCACVPGHSATDSGVFAEFRSHCGISSSEPFSDRSLLLFKITVDSKESGKKQQAKPVVFVGIPHAVPFSRALDLCNRMFCRTTTDPSGEQSQGAFLLDGGFGISVKKSAGHIFMTYGNELTFHTKVDFSRLAFAT
jgi:hypothetical protein